MKLARSSALAALVAAFLVAGPLPARGQDKKPDAGTPKPDPKVEKKEKELKKAKEDLEKELKGKKIDPVLWQNYLERLASQFGLEVKDANALVHKVLAKKIPVNDAEVASGEKYQASIDAKSNKADLKKFTTELTKWINEWKPPKEEKK